MAYFEVSFFRNMWNATVPKVRIIMAENEDEAIKSLKKSYPYKIVYIQDVKSSCQEAFEHQKEDQVKIDHWNKILNHE